MLTSYRFQCYYTNINATLVYQTNINAMLVINYIKFILDLKTDLYYCM
jgi:hypothetical protein